MKKKAIILIILVTLIGGVAYSRIFSKNSKDVLAVKTTIVSKGEVKSYLSTTGIIKSKESNDYYGIQGKVKEVKVKVGDKVKKGDILVTYEAQDLNIAVKQAQLQYDNAVLQNRDLNNQNREITNKLTNINKNINDLNAQIENDKKRLAELAYEKSPNAAEEMQRRQQNIATLNQQKTALESKKETIQNISSEKLKQQENAVALAKLNLDNAKENLAKNKTSIVAEADGTVTAINVQGGAMGSAAQPAVSVQNLDKLKLLVSLGKYDATKVKLGNVAIVKNGDKEVEGKVSFISPVAKKSVTASGSDTVLDIEIDFPGNEESFKIDFEVDVEILLGQANGAVLVPTEAIRSTKNGESFVYVLSNDVVSERKIKLGIQSDMEAEVVDGLKESEKVVLNPNSSLQDGSKVKEVEGGEK